MAWIFPKIEMGLLKWTCLTLCFNFIYADVTEQPQEWIFNSDRKSLNEIKIFGHFFVKFSCS